MNKTLLLIFLLLTGWCANAQNAGNALHFDGTDDYISCPLPALFNNLAVNDFTVEAWINREAAGRIFYAQVDASNFATVLLSGANLLFYVKVSNITYTVSIPIPPSGQWVHTAFTWHAANQLPQVYINGVLQTGVGGGVSSSGTNNVMTIGSRSDGFQPFMGAIDEFRIWNTTRDICQIRSMLYSTPTGAEPDLVSYYNFNRGIAGGNNPTFTLLPDQAGPNTGTLNNFGLTGVTSNWVVSGAPITGEGTQPAYSTATSAVICEGSSYTLGSQTLTTSGTYEELFVSADGCDSLVTLALDVHSIPVTQQNVSACVSYTWPQNNATYTASGVYSDTLTGQYGCDSIIALNLVVAQPTYGAVQYVAACESYTWAQNGQTYLSSGTYTDTLLNQSGCDSILTLDLTLNTPTYGTVQYAAACGSYTWPQNGELYTASGTYTDTIANAAGCDSIVTLALTIHVPVYGPTVSASACGSYLWLQNGETYTLSGTYTDTVVSAAGCDSILALDLTVYNGYTATETVSYCGTSYYWPVTQSVYSAGGVYVANLTGVNGCDSSITLDLQLHAFPVAQVINDEEGTLVGIAQGAVVQDWVDCATGQAIPGQTGVPTYTPAQSGSYAVVVYNPLTSCSDTSDCYAFSMLGMNKLSVTELRIAPNPATTAVQVEFPDERAVLSIRDAQGKLLSVESIVNGTQVSLEHLQAGMYLFCVETEKGTAVRRVVKR